MALRTEDPKSYGSLRENKVEGEEGEVVASKSVSVRKQHRAVVIFSAVVVGLVLLSVIIALVYTQTRPAPSTVGSVGRCQSLLHTEHGELLLLLLFLTAASTLGLPLPPLLLLFFF